MIPEVTLEIGDLRHVISFELIERYQKPKPWVSKNLITTPSRTCCRCNTRCMVVFAWLYHIDGEDGFEFVCENCVTKKEKLLIEVMS